MVWLQDPRAARRPLDSTVTAGRDFQARARQGHRGRYAHTRSLQPGPCSELNTHVQSSLAGSTWLPPKHLMASTPASMFTHNQAHTSPPNLGPSPILANGTPRLDSLPALSNSSALQHPVSHWVLPSLPPCTSQVLTRPLSTGTATTLLAQAASLTCLLTAP